MSLSMLVQRALSYRLQEISALRKSIWLWKSPHSFFLLPSNKQGSLSHCSATACCKKKKKKKKKKWTKAVLQSHRSVKNERKSHNRQSDDKRDSRCHVVYWLKCIRYYEHVMNWTQNHSYPLQITICIQTEPFKKLVSAASCCTCSLPVVSWFSLFEVRRLRRAVACAVIHDMPVSPITLVWTLISGRAIPSKIPTTNPIVTLKNKLLFLFMLFPPNFKICNLKTIILHFSFKVKLKIRA